MFVFYCCFHMKIILCNFHRNIFYTLEKKNILSKIIHINLL